MSGSAGARVCERLDQPETFDACLALAQRFVRQPSVSGTGEGIRQMAEPDDRHLRKAKPAGRQQAAVAGDEHAALIDEARHVEAELGDRSRDLGDLVLRMGPGVRRIRQEPLDRPPLDGKLLTRHR